MNKPVWPMSSLSLKLPKADRSIETYRLAASRIRRREFFLRNSKAR